MLFRIALIIVNFHIVNVEQIGWLLRVLMFLSLSMLIIILQPYKKSYMNVLDGLLLALMGFLTLLLVTFLYILPSSNETLPLMFVTACGFPQLVLLLNVSYRQLKGKQIARYIATKVHTLIKLQICARNQDENELLEDDPLPHRLVSPRCYNRSLLSESEQAHANSETVRGQPTPVYTYGSIS